jgi:peptidyl-tRNA hydrolase
MTNRCVITSLKLFTFQKAFLAKKKHLCYYPGRIGDAPVMLAKPQTFMNASGESVSITIRKKL